MTPEWLTENFIKPFVIEWRICGLIEPTDIDSSSDTANADTKIQLTSFFNRSINPATPSGPDNEGRGAPPPSIYRAGGEPPMKKSAILSALPDRLQLAVTDRDTVTYSTTSTGHRDAMEQDARR